MVLAACSNQKNEPKKENQNSNPAQQITVLETMKEAEQKVNEAKIKELKRFETTQENEEQKPDTDAEKIAGSLQDAAAKNVAATLNKQAEEAEKKEDTRTPEEKAQWLKLVGFVADHGETSESITGIYMSISDMTAKTRFETHIGNYLSLIGGPDAKGGFNFNRVEAVWENWKVTEEKQLDGEQWLFLLSRDGKVAKYWHYHFLKKMDDTVLIHQGIDTTDEDANKKWDEVRASWYQKMADKK